MCKTILLLFCGLLASSRAFGLNTNAYVIEEGGEVYNQLLPIAKDWMNAVARKDIDRLLSYTTSDERPYIKKGFTSTRPRGRLYAHFFVGVESLAHFFSSQEKIAITLVGFRTSPLSENFNACYYDKTKKGYKAFKSGGEWIACTTKQNCRCASFYMDEGHWNVSYEIDD